MTYIETLSKRIWFVVLMVFAIGWSGVSIASNSLMHIQSMSMQDHMQMLSENGANHTVEMQVHQADQHMPMGCHDNNMQMTHHEKISCDPIKRVDHKTSQIHCNECSQLLCQTMIVWVDSAPFLIQKPQFLTSVEIQNLNPQSQHLTGFWQEILRPPKA